MIGEDNFSNFENGVFEIEKVLCGVIGGDP